jgi:tetratricopeptide (TPR) repeat protein
MFPGLLLGVLMGAPPDPETRLPTVPESHKDALARFGAAVWNLHRDRLVTAARQLEEVMKKDPDATAPLKELIRVYSLIGREPDAIKIAKRILEKDPHDFDVAHSLSRLLFDAGELKEAVAAAKLAAESPIPLSRAETAVGVYRDLATLCEKANDPATAAIALKKAIALVVDKRKEVLASGAFTPSEADTAAAECLERLGKVQTKLKKYDEASTSFTAAARLFKDPLKANDPSAAARLDWNLSGVLQARGDAAEALEHLDRLFKLQPLTPEPYTRLGQLLRTLDRESEIIPRLEKCDRADSKNLALQTVLAIEKARSVKPGERRQAETLFDTIHTKTNDPKLMELVVRLHLELGQATRIIQELDRAFVKLNEANRDEKSVDTPQSAALKAFAAEKARTIADILYSDPEGTEAVLRAAKSMLQDGITLSHQTCYYLGQLAGRAHKLGLAELLFEDAMRRGPKETRGEACLALISVLQMAGKPARVAEICHEGPRIAESIAPFVFYYHRSEALAELGDSAAIAEADKAIQATGHSNRLSVKLHKVRVLQILGKLDDAIALSKKLFDEFPSTSDQMETHHVLATTYWLAGKRVEAEAELRAILEIDPDNAGACNDLGYYLASQSRNLDEAERLIRNAIALDRFDRKKSGAAELENAMYIDSLGWVLFRKGKLQEARVQLERAAEMHAGESSPEVLDHLGDVLFRLGEKAKAKAEWEKAVKVYENDPRTSLRRGDDRLDELKRKIKLAP